MDFPEQSAKPKSLAPVLDRQVLADLAEGADDEDLEMLRRVVASYCSGRLVTQAREAMHSGQWDALERAAHSLKGLSATLGAMAVAAAAAELERRAEQRDGAACRRQIERVATEHGRSRGELADTELYDASLVAALRDD